MHYNQLVHVVIRMAKEESAFIYSTLEACEGLFFYTTIKHLPAQKYRDVDIKGSVSFISEIDHVIEDLKTRYSIKVINHSIIDDLMQ